MLSTQLVRDLKFGVGGARGGSVVVLDAGLWRAMDMDSRVGMSDASLVFLVMLDAGL